MVFLLKVRMNVKFIIYSALNTDWYKVPLELDSKFHPQWNGLIPDGLFKDTEKPTIVEVFGMSESDKEYHLHRQYKIELFKELSNYDFWFWDAFNESPLPSLPLKKK